jgi:ketosteroid isomerase-like protein
MKNRMMLVMMSFISLVFAPFMFGASCTEDKAGIQKTLEEYRKAWLANDEERVMRTLTADAILLPASARTSVAGNKAIREFWWPSNSSFSIEEFDQPLLEVSSCGDLGYARGTSRVAWSSLNNGVKTKNESTTNFLAILKKDHDTWRITHLTWYQTN